MREESGSRLTSGPVKKRKAASSGTLELVSFVYSEATLKFWIVAVQSLFAILLASNYLRDSTSSWTVLLCRCFGV